MMPITTLRRIATPSWLRLIALLALSLFCLPALAGDFAVSPLLVYFEGNAKSGQITVRNDGTEELRFEIHGRDWKQDATGADRYEDSDDLIFFPRSMAVPAGQTRIVRVGVKA